MMGGSICRCMHAHVYVCVMKVHARDASHRNSAIVCSNF